MTLVEMLERNVLENPDKTALVCRDLSLSYVELNSVVNSVANSMAAVGVKKGDITAVMLERVPELIIAFLASLKIGAVVTPINYNLTRAEIEKVLCFLRPAVLFSHEKHVGKLDESALCACATTVLVDGRSAQYAMWDEFTKGPIDEPCVEISGGDTAYLNYTTGSTGEQKGAVATHDNIYWNTLSSVETFAIGPGDVHLCMFISFAHPHELFARALYTGGTIVLLNEIFPKSLAATIRDNAVTCMMGLAPMYELLLDVASTSELGTLRIAESGGMFTRPELVERFKQVIGIPIHTVWGSTETTGIAIANSVGHAMKPGSVGKVCPYYELRLVGEDGRQVRTGEIGELAFKGPGVVKGYYQLPEETDKAFVDGWYFSGDLARRDEDGFVYFVDRKSAMMKVAGLKVFPLEIERVLSTHPCVKEVAVIKNVDGLRGEVPLAVVVPEYEGELSTKDVHHYLRDKLPNHKIPRHVVFIKELPKVGSGKVDKKSLTSEYCKEVDGEGTGRKR